MLNQPHDQDQLERSAPIQPELRAIDAYNAQEDLIEWIRGFGVTTVHTGHAPGELMSGQTLIAKTIGNTVADAVIVEAARRGRHARPGRSKDRRQVARHPRQDDGHAARRADQGPRVSRQARTAADSRRRTKGEPAAAATCGWRRSATCSTGELPLMITTHRGAGHRQRAAAGQGVQHQDLARRRRPRPTC